MSANKETKVGVLWNVKEQRVESIHESLAAAKNAARQFVSKSGAGQDLLDLDTAEFSVRAPKAAD